MSNEFTDDPIAKALLKHLATERGRDDPVGELARELLESGVPLRDLLRNPWYGEGLAAAAEAGQAELSRMAPEQLKALEDAATRLSEARDAAEGDNE
ncbi:hypothetical protein GCM10010112_86730 [Actinoplanes lobatus]|uniref:Uncharacterized protein n=1 Tax=Actinoplanes lobatus TaxID=113568 RepID=A0A7W7HCS4_9ACTN|nr:hypothetical protein [Actinoplanes lobatus]MBB4747787.1 hypothetical protein [Actinoplanes lobatus]GGN95937.1 hypothetical protein GCM10010112_86730 [Actinoplanes lobatus]GIE45137.1 hypothetical protein Alo02nite_80350 [Actinoplanes lobatus]